MLWSNSLINRDLPRFISLKAIAAGFALSLSVVVALPASAVVSIDSPSSYQVVVNKARPLNPIKYAPSDLVYVPKAFNPKARMVRSKVSQALVAMGNAMKLSAGRTLVIDSGYRSYSVQKTVHDQKVALLGLVRGENLAARPGFSEHQTGLAVDLSAVGASGLSTSFASTVAGKWLASNAYKYGFVMRYPRGYTDITGYQWEPWHFRYVGLSVATAMHNAHIATLEQYFSLPNAPSYLN